MMRSEYPIKVLFTDGTHMVCDGLGLTASATIIVPGLCFGVIPHEEEIEVDGFVLLVREQGAFTERNLLVDQGPVVSGKISTGVFNLSNTPAKIKKGESISRLVAL